MQAVLVHGNQRIAAYALGMGLRTLKTHLQMIRERLEVDDTVQAMAIYAAQYL